jgi:hypothetical protein
MQILQSDQTQLLYFTATEWMYEGSYLYLYIKHSATNETYFLSFAKSSDLSTDQNRYNAFSVAVPVIPEGQCTYVLYEGDAGATSPESSEISGIVEVGLYEIQRTESTDPTIDNSIEYILPNV